MQYNALELSHSSAGGSRLPVCDAPVSMFRHAKDSTPQTTVPLRTVLDAIRQGAYRMQVEAVRGIYEQSGKSPGYDSAKRKLPALTPCGTFAPTRGKAHLQAHSGIVHGDLDHFDSVEVVKAMYANDPHVAYAFLSPSGDGLKVGIRVAPVTTDGAYQHAWQVVAATYGERYGVLWDTSGRDSCRLCFVTHDPQLYVNPLPDIFPVPPPVQTAAAPQAPRTRTENAAPSLERRYAESALATAVRWIATSQPGGRHKARCKAAYLLGGLLGQALTYEEAYAALEAAVRANTTTPEASLQTIRDCLAAGAAQPLTAPQVSQVEADIVGVNDDGTLPPELLTAAPPPSQMPQVSRRPSRPEKAPDFVDPWLGPRSAWHGVDVASIQRRIIRG